MPQQDYFVLGLMTTAYCQYLKGSCRGGFRHVQHVRPNRGPLKNGAPTWGPKKFLQRANIPKLPESHWSTK